MKYPQWMWECLRDEHSCDSQFVNNKFYLTWSINYELYGYDDIEIWWKLYPEHFKEDIEKAKYGVYDE